MTDATACKLENGYDCCVFCYVPFGGENNPERHVPHPGFGGGINFTYGHVIDPTDRTVYEFVGLSDGDTPLAHIDCYHEWAEAIDDQNRTLFDYDPDAETTP